MKTLKITVALVALVAVFTLTVSGNSADKAMEDVRKEKNDNIKIHDLVIDKKKSRTGSEA